MAETQRQQSIRLWTWHINKMIQSLEQFRDALPNIKSDIDFMREYHHLSVEVGDVLDGFDVGYGGTIDDLREVLSNEH